MSGFLRILMAGMLAASALAGAARAQDFQGRMAEALDSLATVIDEDRAAGQSGGSIDPASTQALRDSLAAMVLAAGQEGKPPATVERVFAYAALKRFGRDVPDWLKDGKGRLDTATLLSSAGLYSAASPSGGARRDTGYLSAIRAEGADTRVRSAGGAAQSGAEPAAPAQPAAEAAEAPAPPSPAVVEEAGERFVVVQAGDTLTSLALRHYGDMLEYRRIYAANRDVIQNPSLLFPGTRLRLPR